MKYIVLFILIVFNLNASEMINYQTNYEKALTNAVQSNKILMMLVTTKSCPWCKKLENQVLKKENISKLINENFIPLYVDLDLINYPKKFEIKVVPTIYFINAKDEMVIEKSMGYKNKKDFENILRGVIK